MIFRKHFFLLVGLLLATVFNGQNVHIEPKKGFDIASLSESSISLDLTTQINLPNNNNQNSVSAFSTGYLFNRLRAK
jgi:hypothetical protein